MPQNQRDKILNFVRDGKLSTEEISRKVGVRAGQVRAIKAEETAKKAIKWAKWEIGFKTKDKKRWQIVSFLGPNGRESTGIVDLLAIRKDHKSDKTKEAPLKMGDLFEIILIQVKGGGARMPSIDERHRLRKVCGDYKARRIIVASWKKGTIPKVPILYCLPRKEPDDKFQWEDYEMDDDKIKGLLW
jgi:hypothetical protein